MSKDKIKHPETESSANFSVEKDIKIKIFPYTYRLIKYIIPYKLHMLLAISCLLFGTSLALMFPGLVVRMLEGIATSRDYHVLNKIAGTLFAMFLLQSLCGFIQSYLMAFVGERVIYDLRTSLYKHIHSLSFEFFEAQRVGDLVSRLSSDVILMRAVLTTNIAMLLSQVMITTGALFFMIKMNAKLTFLILGLAPLMISVVALLSKQIKQSSTRVQDKLANSAVIAEEGIQNIHVVKCFGRDDYEINRYFTAMKDTFRAALRAALYNSILSSTMGFLGLCSIATIIWFGGREVIAGRLTTAQITGFLIFGIQIAGSLGGLASLFGQLSGALGGVQRVFDLLDMEPSIRDSPEAKVLSSSAGQITFHNVSFGYGSLSPVIQDFSLDVKQGEVLALVGPSGAGKSTLFKLIPRFFDPTKGSILLDGEDLRSFTQESLRNLMAIVPQETMLFGGTIRENLMYGRLNATEAEMISAAKEAHADEFIMSLPGQYDHVLRERGINLSGGQRQRISIARAILKNPRILLLDEATSALDNESEEFVQDAISRLMVDDRTTIIIAHRLSTIRIAHRIAVMDKGRIVELGTHEVLMDLQGLYAKLYAMQFRPMDDGYVLS